MKVFSDSFSFKTQGEFDFVDLSARVDKIVRKSGIMEGIALVFAGHATGVLVVTEYESRLLNDIREFIRDLVPSQGRYYHPGNASAHLRSMIFAPSEVILCMMDVWPWELGRAFFGWSLRKGPDIEELKCTLWELSDSQYHINA